jgi:hypothetical protein
MRVRTVREHENEYGDKHRKAVGDEYDVAEDRDARTLISAGYVERVEDKPKAGK